MKLLILLVLLLTLNAEEAIKYAPVEGDMLIQSFPGSPLTTAIESCTKSEYSHCGIVEFKDGKPYVIEAVGPVKETEFAKWVNHGRKSKYVAMRMKDNYTKRIPDFIQAAKAYLGKPYDMHMDMDDAKIYCSELLYKAFKEAYKEEIGKVQKLGDLNWQPSEQFIRKIEHGGLPLERVMITPLAIVDSDKLIKVFSNY